MDRFDNEKRREFVEKLKNSKKKKCEIVQLCLERMIFKKSIRRIVALFVDSLGSNERLKILNGKFGTIIETRSYDGLKKHEGLKGRRLMGKTRFEKFDLAERKGGNERRIAAAGRARRISGSPPREDLYVQWSPLGSLWFENTEPSVLSPFPLPRNGSPFASVLVKQEQSTYNSALAIFLFRVQHGRRKG